MHRPLVAALVSIAAAFLFAAGFAPAGAAETVTFPGNGVTLSAVLYRPTGSGPFPAVVALHGCGGPNDRRGTLGARHVDWAERLVAQGFMVLFPDSFGSRGAGSQCSTRERAIRPRLERLGDVVAAKTFLQGRSDVKAGAVSLLGWSHGGSTVLYAVTGERPADGKPDFAKAVAFYPGCRVPLQRGLWKVRLPLLILIGEADDWTAAEPCRELAQKAKAAGAPVSIVVYAGAYHGFDSPNSPLRQRTGLAFTANKTGVAHQGTDPAGRADAIARVPPFLAK
jgi:dienelactone hydrolase